VSTRTALAWSPGAAGPLLEPEPDLSWRDAARCAEADPEAFFPERGGSTKAAKRICMGCEARVQCLEFALDNEEVHGIWGGTTWPQRRALLAARYPGAPVCPACSHFLAGRNLLPGGGCRSCTRNAERGAETRRLTRGLAA
jgi:WhiB family transcriptional regulator, redox-sensing transcriptional regulator